jgi:hypothetical protein
MATALEDLKVTSHMPHAYQHDVITRGAWHMSYHTIASHAPRLCTQDQLGALDRRLVDLEHTASAFPAADHATQQDGPAADTDSVHHSIQSTPSAAADSASTHIPAAGAQQGLGLSPADLQDIQRQQEQLARQLADVAAAQTGLQQQVSVLQDSKADRGDVRNMLSEGLQGKVDIAAVSQLKAQLGDKADRSELDVLMNAMSASGSAFSPEDASSPAGAETGSTSHADTAAAQDPATDTAGVGSTPNGSTSDQAAAQAGDAAAAGSGSGLSPSRRGTREVAGGGDVGQQLSKLQLQVALLQDHVNKKVSPRLVIANSISKQKQQLLQHSACAIMQWSHVSYTLCGFTVLFCMHCAGKPTLPAGGCVVHMLTAMHVDVSQRYHATVGGISDVRPPS